MKRFLRLLGLHKPRVSDYMTRNLVTFSESDTISDVILLLDPKVFQHMPITNAEGKLVGILSQRDLVNVYSTILTDEALDSKVRKLVVKDLMTKELITTTPDTPTNQAAATMVDKHIHALPVLDGDELIGIITSTDIMRAYKEV